MGRIIYAELLYAVSSQSGCNSTRTQETFSNSVDASRRCTCTQWRTRARTHCHHADRRGGRHTHVLTSTTRQRGAGGRTCEGMPSWERRCMINVTIKGRCAMAAPSICGRTCSTLVACHCRRVSSSTARWIMPFVTSGRCAPTCVHLRGPRTVLVREAGAQLDSQLDSRGRPPDGHSPPRLRCLYTWRAARRASATLPAPAACSGCLLWLATPAGYSGWLLRVVHGGAIGIPGATQVAAVP